MSKAPITLKTSSSLSNFKEAEINTDYDYIIPLPPTGKPYQLLSEKEKEDNILLMQRHAFEDCHFKHAGRFANHDSKMMKK